MTSLTTYVPDCPVLNDVGFKPWVKRVAFVLFCFFVFAPICAIFAPWTQNVAGAGRVVAFTPLDRPQSVEATVKGRVKNVFVIEAQEVEEGEPLIELVDIDPEKIERIKTKLSAANTDLKAAVQSGEIFGSMVETLESARDLNIKAFEAKVEVVEQKLDSARQKLKQVEAKRDALVEEEQRKAKLVPQFVAELDLIQVRAKLREATAGVASANADIEALQADLRSARATLGKERDNANAKVQEASSKVQSQTGKAAELRGKIADLEGELRAQETQMITAPRAGRVFRLSVNSGSSIVNQGQVLLQIVPAAAQSAVELYMRGVDAPLIEVGRKVRLQFEGWPAVQFVGWPAVAVGTFGGVVALVDPTDSGRGRFRVLVVPDPEDRKWPDERWLRQGVRAKGWVLLNEVKIWWELWRQLNGFPPVVALSEPEESAGGSGKGDGKSFGGGAGEKSGPK